MRVLLPALLALALSGTADAASDTIVYSSQYLWKNYDRCLGDVLYSHLGGYYYCYVSEYNHFDYCSPAPQGNNFARPLLNKAFTLVEGPCKDDCSWSRNDNKYMCHSYWDDWLACNPKLYPFFKSYTYKGDECFGTCDKHDGEDHYWCRTDLRTAKYCSPYKLNSEQLKPFELMNSILRCSPNSGNASRKKRQLTFCSTAAHTPGSIERYITALMALSAASSLFLYSQPNQQEGVYRYAYLQPITPNSPTLPLMISARVTNNTVLEPGTRLRITDNVQTNVMRMGSHRGRRDDNNDDNGHLIASENGGPHNETYNFVPQARSLNRGMTTGAGDLRQSAWRSAENSINQWARSGRIVDQTVVVVYENLNGVINPRPVGFAQQVVYYNADGTVRYTSQDYYSNNPDDEPEFFPITP